MWKTFDQENTKPSENTIYIITNGYVKRIARYSNVKQKFYVVDNRKVDIKMSVTHFIDINEIPMPQSIM